MTTLVSRMERGGWLRRDPDPDDRRAVRVTISDSGRSAYVAGIRHYSESLAIRLRKIGSGEWAALAAGKTADITCGVDGGVLLPLAASTLKITKP